MKNMLFLFFIIFTMWASADTVFVEPTKGTGLNTDENLATVTELVKSSIRDQNKHQLVDDQKKAQLTLRSRLLRLGSSYVMTIEKYDGPNLKFSSQIKAKNFEEMDNVCARLVRAVIDEVTLKTDSRVDDVTENEQVAGTRRKDTVNRWNFGFGPARVYNLNENDTQMNWNLGYNWEVDPNFALKIFLDGTSSRASQLGIGVNYYMNNRDISPVVYAGLGYGSTTIKDEGNFFGLGETKTGFAVGAGVGVQFFRTSRVNLELLLHASHHLTANRMGAPGVYGLRVSLYW